MSLRSDGAELGVALKEDETPSQAIKGRTARTGWAHIAKSWRRIAERMIAARTNGRLSTSLKPTPATPMQYQQSFYSLG
ncbi:MAG TPA: hypothetical protein VKR31_11465 [Rhizomicrobium sp.]|nr:hypothetical protein [Rhizomicrobium sp.]